LSARFVVPGVWRVTFAKVNVNVYLLDVEGRLVAIDAGPPGGETRLLAGVAGLGRAAGDVEQIVLTHAHADHAGAADALARATGAPVYMQPAEAVFASHGEPGPDPGAEGRGARMLWSVVRRSAPEGYPPVDVEGALLEGDAVPGGQALRVVETPGHSPGHIAVVWERPESVLFTGDAAWSRSGPDVGPANVDGEEARRSFRRLAGLGFETACFGRGRPITPGASTRFRARAARLGG